MAILVWLCFFCLLFTAASLEALAQFSRSRLEKYCQTRNIAVLSKILEHDDDVVLGIRGWARVFLLGYVVSIYAAFGGRDGGWTWVEQLILLWVILVVAETWVARPLGAIFAEPFLYWTWTVQNILRLTMLPILWAANLITNALERLSRNGDEEPTSAIQDEILTVVNEGEREGAILGDAVDMIAGLMELHEVEVAEIMTPRTDMVMFPLQMSVEEARQEVTACGHSRIPVYKQNRDDIVGVLYAKDLLPHLDRTGNVSGTLASIKLRKPVYVSETKPVDVLLREFQKQRIHIAIVLDEYGGAAGLVTIEDIIEEIVGEIEDEYDEEENPPIKVIDDRTSEVDGRVEVESLNEMLSMELPEDADYDTVSGFIFTTLGYIPKVGESFVHDNTRFTVLEATDRAINRVRLERVDEGQPVES